VAQFAGTTRMSCVIEDDILCLKSMTEEGKKTYAFGTLTLSTSNAGAVTGSFTDGLGGAYAFSGKIDPLGNLQGSADLKGRKFRVSAKIAPPSLYKTYPGFNTAGQLIEFVDDKGYRVAVIGHLNL
jgi:hypothetical protein